MSMEAQLLKASVLSRAFELRQQFHYLEHVPIHIYGDNVAIDTKYHFICQQVEN
jgi:hypothetical protein